MFQEIFEISCEILWKMVFYRFSWKSSAFWLILRLIPTVTTNFHAGIEEKPPGTFG